MNVRMMTSIQGKDHIVGAQGSLHLKWLLLNILEAEIMSERVTKLQNMVKARKTTETR